MPVKLYPFDPPLLEGYAVVDSPDESTTMATNKEVKAWISEEVRKAVDEAIDSFNPHGWRKAFHILREMAPLGGIFMVVIGLCGIAVTLGIVAFGHVDQNARFQQHAEDRLSGIEKELAALSAHFEIGQPNVAEKIPDLIKRRATPTGDVNLNLHVIQALATQASDSGVVADPVAMTDAQRTLLDVALTKPDLGIEPWKALSAVINYQQYIISKKYHIEDILRITKPCGPQTGEFTSEPAAGYPHVYKVRLPTYSNCLVTLDGGTWKNVRFDHCLLSYQGGPVNDGGLLMLSASLFQVALEGRPPTSAAWLLKVMAESSSPELNVPAPAQNPPTHN